MTVPLIVETNFLLDLILDQHQASSRLVEVAEQDRCHLVLPSVAIIEALKNVEQRQTDLRRARDSMGRASAVIVTQLAEAESLLEARLWTVLDRLAPVSEILEVTSPMLLDAQNMRDQLKLSPADSLVAAAAVSAAEKCPHFMSRDRQAFGNRDDVLEYLAQRGIRYFADAAEFLTYLASEESG